MKYEKNLQINTAIYVDDVQTERILTFENLAKRTAT
jgi:hypothetical protein